MYTELDVKSALCKRKQYCQSEATKEAELNLLVAIQYCKNNKIVKPVSNKYRPEFLTYLTNNGVDCAVNGEKYVFTLPNLEGETK